MSVQEKLQTITLIDYKNDQTVTIVCKYLSNDPNVLPNILFVDIADSNINYNGTLIKEGNLISLIKNYPNVINLQIDDNGHLILFLTLPEENFYSVETTEGRLLYDKQ